MVKFKPHRVDRANRNTPIISNREIDAFAEAVLADYKPKLLRAPGVISYTHFLENYLGFRTECKDIYSEDPNEPILAMTAFGDDWVDVFDEEDECVKAIMVQARTVIFDNMLMEEGKESLALFSGLHEGGHILLHGRVYGGDSFSLGGDYDGDDWDDGFIDDNGGDFMDDDGDCDDSEPIKPLVCCRRGSIESFGKRKPNLTAAEWREHHADYFAAALAMPNATFMPFVRQLLREHDIYRGAITLGNDEDLDILANDLLPEEISEVYGVSKKAARIKLRTAGFVLSGKAYRA